LSIGRRDALLLRLRQETFGPLLEAIAECPGCGEILELSFRVADVQVQKDPEPDTWHTIATDDFEVRFRMPTGSDLVAIEEQVDLTRARRTLIERCVEWTRAGRKRSPVRLPGSVIRRVGEEMAAADPQAVVDLMVRCPSCRKEHTFGFDIASFLWNEIQAWTPRVLLEVHDLATAYGWNEAEILALSPWRRHAYLGMVGV
jgi:hypothetical protein